MTNVKTQSGIYCWSNKINGKKYIGQAQNIKKRKYTFLSFNHYGYAGDLINRARQKYNNREYWNHEVLEYCTIEELNDKETYWIKWYKEKGYSLYNLTDGGDGTSGYKLSEETKRKIGESNKGENNYFYGKHLTEEHKNKISKANKGRIKTEEERKKLSEALTGKIVSEETRKKISEIQTGKKLSEKTRKKISESHKGEKAYWFGKHLTEETRKKLSESHKEYWNEREHPRKGKKMSEEFCEKVRKGRKGKPLLNKRISVLQIDINTNEIIKEWDSISIAENALGIKHIGDCINGRRHKAGNFIWKKKTA